MQIVLHIGPPKTGSSAIQHWCALNRDNLQASGIYYPEHDLDVNGISSGNLLSIYERNAETGELVFSNDKFSQVKKDARNAGADVLLLSSEFFFKNVNELAINIPSASFVAYIRFELTKLVSSYNQSVKRHGKTETFTAPGHTRAQSIQLLKKYISNHGEQRFILRAYCNNAFTSGDIVTDFLTIFDKSDITAAESGVKQINSGYSSSGLELKRWFNKFELGPLQNALDEFLQKEGAHSQKYSLLSNEEFSRLHNGYLKELVSFCNKYEVAGSEQLIQASETVEQAPVVLQHIGLKSFTSLINAFVRDKKDNALLLLRFLQSVERKNVDKIDALRLRAIESSIPKSVLAAEQTKLLFSKLVSLSAQVLKSARFRRSEDALSPTEKIAKLTSLSSGGNKCYGNVVLVSHHIPKTAGSSLAESLKNAYGEAAVYGVYRGTGAAKLRRGESIWLPEKTEVLHGHFEFNEKQRQFFPNAVRICWVRDPLERIWSHFHHVMTYEQPSELYQKIITLSQERGIVNEEKLFEEVVTSKRFSGMTNIYSNYIGREGIRHFDFIGSVHKYDEDLLRLSSLTGKRFDKARINQSAKSSTLPEHLSYLKAHLASEYDLISDYL